MHFVVVVVVVVAVDVFVIVVEARFGFVLLLLLFLLLWLKLGSGLFFGRVTGVKEGKMRKEKMVGPTKQLCSDQVTSMGPQTVEKY